jgi:hypothetical protein
LSIQREGEKENYNKQNINERSATQTRASKQPEIRVKEKKGKKVKLMT